MAKESTVLDGIEDLIPDELEPLKPVKRRNVETDDNSSSLRPVEYEDASTNKFGQVTKVPCHTENFERLCEKYNLKIRYNSMRNLVEYSFGDGFYPNSDNADNVSLTRITDYMVKEKFIDRNRVGEMVLAVADKNSYHPFKDYILSRSWDGESRLNAFFETVVVKDEDRLLRNIYLKRWLLQIAAVLSNERGSEAHGVLIFTGRQGMGKTRWIRELGKAVNGAVLTGHTLNLNDKDSRLQALSSTICELGELDSTFRKSEVSALKAFLSNREDRIRKAYARVETVIARRTVFFGSVNDSEFLQDTTGNRRYWVLEPEELINGHKIDIQQLLAEVFYLYENGETQFLTDEESQLMMCSNNRYLNMSPVLSTFIEKFYNAEGKKNDHIILKVQGTVLARLSTIDERKNNVYVSISDILEVIGFGSKANKRDRNELSSYIENTLGGEKKRFKNGVRFLLPESFNDSDVADELKLNLIQNKESSSAIGLE